MTREPDQGKYILSLDEGTTFCKASLWDEQGRMVSSVRKRIPLSYPQNGWVEADPKEIWKRQLGAAKEAIKKVGCEIGRIAAIGLANQRETTVVWDDRGKPVYPAIIWQDRRTSNLINGLNEEDSRYLSEITGLIPDPYFSATKIKWICDLLSSTNPEKRKLSAGTIDSWIAYNLTAGKSHVTDYSNASRTMLLDIHKGEWSSNALEIFGIDGEILPDLTFSQGGDVLTSREIFGCEIPVLSIVGDQQASLFGHLATNKGDTKNTYGTGSFLLQNNGTDPSRRGRLITSIAWKIEGNPMIYSVEGNIFNTGSVADWTGSTIKSGSALGNAGGDPSSLHGLYFVPALSGLGAPYWEPSARGTVYGITAGTQGKDILKSALESIAFRVRDVVEELRKSGGNVDERLAVDGGLTRNEYLMQFQADILGLKITQSDNHEVTSAGAAYMAGIACGLWDIDFLVNAARNGKEYIPKMERELSDSLYGGWTKAVSNAIRHYRVQNS